MSFREDYDNPDLFNENEAGDYTYNETDYGKSASGQLELRTGERSSYNQRIAGGEDRRENDDGGHLIGTRFNGSKDLENIDAQNSNLNRGSYKTMENELADSLEKGDKVYMNVETFKSNESDRPDVYMGYSITEKQDGSRDYDMFSFTNESAETQESWNNEIADNPLYDEYDNPLDYDPSEYAEELSDDSYSYSDDVLSDGDDYSDSNDSGEDSGYDL